MQPCKRLILVRNTQQVRNLMQQQGDMKDYGLPRIITPKGQEMAKCLAKGLDMYMKRPICEKDPSHTAVLSEVYYENEAALETIKPFLDDKSDIPVYKLETNELPNTIFNSPKSNVTEVVIICGSGLTLRKEIWRMLNLHPSVSIGPPLCSVTMLDILPSHIFLHTVNDLSPLALGGWPVHELFMWNNTQ